MHFGFMDVILLHSGHHPEDGHSCCYLQGGENKHTNIIKMCLNNSTVKNHTVFA